jgi:hypothetical protein
MGIAQEGKPGIIKCAFCKSWYDPTNSAIEPMQGIKMWKYDQRVKKKCRASNDMLTIASHTCPKFQCKL